MVQMTLIFKHCRAHACSENGLKWFLFLFFDLGAALRFASLFGLFAISAFLEPAEVFEATERKGHNLYGRV
jgi:hypothetical protein